jgi:hypothetical protein
MAEPYVICTFGALTVSGAGTTVKVPVLAVTA